MICNNKIISSIRKTHGGKYYLCRKIIGLIEYNKVFVEGFAGGISVYLNINEKFDKVFIFDKDPDIICMWKSLQIMGNQIRNFLLNTTYDEENFKRAVKYVNEHKDNPDDFWYPIMLIIKNRFSRGGLGKNFAWSNRTRGGIPGDVNGWKNNITYQLPLILEKIKDVHFECGDCKQLIVNHGLDKLKGLSGYYDPPYLHNTRISKNSYGLYEMENHQHEELISFLKNNISGISYLSGYNSPEYSRWLEGYHKWEWQISNSASQSKNKPIMTECLWKIG